MTTTNAPRAANDNAQPILAWPTLARLAKARDLPRVMALCFWRDLTAPQRQVTATDLAGEDSVDEDLCREFRPSESEILGAIGWRVIDRERWHHTGRVVNVYQPAPDERPILVDRDTDTRQLGELFFRRGKLVEYGRTANDKPKKPADRTRGAKGARATMRNPARYLGLTGAVPSPLHTTGLVSPFSGEAMLPDFYDPLPREFPTAKDPVGRYGVEEGRALLRDYGVDGSVPFHRLPVTAKRCPDFTIHGKQWRGGIVRGKGTGAGQAWDGASATRCTPGDIGQHMTEEELSRNADERRLRDFLGDHITGVLDMAITDATAKEIGEAWGYAPSSAKKYGANLIDKAIDALVAVVDMKQAATAANDNYTEEQKLAA